MQLPNNDAHAVMKANFHAQKKKQRNTIYVAQNVIKSLNILVIQHKKIIYVQAA